MNLKERHPNKKIELDKTGQKKSERSVFLTFFSLEYFSLSITAFAKSYKG
jgi:hypothetical protein